jgi:hypothetical protein
MYRRIVTLLLVIVFLPLAWQPVSQGMPQGGLQPSPGARSVPRFKPGFNLFTPQQDVEIGFQSAQKIMQETPMINDPQIVGYVRDLGARLVSRAAGDKFPYQFQVVATREINAFALPGGFLFVNVGAITAARNEGELAGVMAHEISHAALRHGTNQASRARLLQLGLSILDQAVPSSRTSNLGQIMSAIGGFGANLLFLKFDRGAEKQADLEGARIVAEAGYDPRDMANFFSVLAASGGQRPPEFLSDHPDDGNRTKYILNAIPSLPVSARPVHNTPEFERVKARLLGSASISPRSQLHRLDAESPANPGYKRPETPAASFKTYREKDDRFTLEAPANWEGIVINNSDANSEYILAPKGGYGKLNDSMFVTHGVFVGAIRVPERDLRSATAALIQRELEANPGYRIVRETAEAPFHNQRGLVTVMAGPSVITGLTEVDVIFTAVTTDGRLFYLTTVAPEDETETYYSTFKHMQQSVKLTNAISR